MSTLHEARLYGEKMRRDKDETVRRCGEDLIQILDAAERAPSADYCVTCGAPRTLWTSGEGTTSYAPAPILRIIFEALREQGWAFEDGVYVDPEGNKYGNVEGAVTAQTFREIAAS